MRGCGNRDGLMCNLSPIDQVQLTTHPHKCSQWIWIALDMQMMCWVKPVGERLRSEKKNKRSIHSSSTFCTSARIWFLRKPLKEGVKHYAKQQIVPRLFHLKKVLLSYLGQVQIILRVDCLMRFQCLLNVPVTHSAAMHSFDRFACKSNHTGLMMSPP